MEILAALLSGTGLSVLTHIGSMVDNALEARRELKRMALEQTHELKLIEFELQRESLAHEHEYAVASDTNDTQALLAAYGHDNAIGVASQWVVNVLRLVRPVLTFLLLGLVFWAVRAVPENAADVVGDLTTATVGVIGFWFGDRSLRSKRELN